MMMLTDSGRLLIMYLAIDTETSGFSWYDEAFLATIADESGSAVFELPEERDALSRVLYSADGWIFHNAKY